MTQSCGTNLKETSALRELRTLRVSTRAFGLHVAGGVQVYFVAGGVQVYFVAGGVQVYFVAGGVQVYFVAGGVQVYSVAGGVQVYFVAGGVQVYSVAGGVQVYFVAGVQVYYVTNYITCCCFLFHLQPSKNYIKELSWNQHTDTVQRTLTTDKQTKYDV